MQIATLVALTGVTASAATITNQVFFFTGTTNQVMVRYQAIDTPQFIGGNAFYGGQLMSLVTNGFLSNSLAPGRYTVEFIGTGRMIPIAVPSVDGFYSLAQCATNIMSYTNVYDAMLISSRVQPGSGLVAGTNNPGLLYESLTLGINGSAVLPGQVAASNVISGGSLAAAVMPAYSGDITTSAGSTSTTLKNTGTAGTYTKITFDAQGRETSGTTLSAGDIPDLSLTYELHRAILTNQVPASNVISGGTLSAAVMPAYSGDITTSAGSTSTALKSTGTAGTYTKATFDGQGRETSGTTLSASDIPGLPGSIIGSGTVVPPYLGTNVIIAAGPGVTITTNYSGGVLTYTFQATNSVNLYLSTNNVDYITVNTNSYITVLNDIVLNGKSYINLTVATNLPGSGFQFATRTTPDSNGTNWIVDAAKQLILSVKLTNDFNLLYLTNSLTGASGALCSLNLLPNGADRQITLNSNMCLLDTNGWTLLTTMNPGLWYQKLTNSPTSNGGRCAWISMGNGDTTYNQTNTRVRAQFSP